MFSFRSSYPIALDIGNQNVYAVQLKDSKMGFLVKELAHGELNGSGEDSPETSHVLISKLRDIVKSKRFVGRRAIAHIPSQRVFSFPIQFQVRKSETLEEAILRESREYLPFPVEEAVIDYPSIVALPTGESEQYKATIAAVRSGHVTQYVHDLKKIGLTLEAVDLSICSLIRLHKHLHDMSQNPIILCNIGQTQSLFSVVASDTILAQRNVSWGIQTLYDRILANLGLSEDQHKAKVLLKKHGLLYDDPQQSGGLEEGVEMDQLNRTIYQIITPHVEELIYEFHKLIGYVRSEEQNPAFERICLYGHSIFIRRLDHYLEKRLNIPTKLVNPMAESELCEDGMLPEISEGAPYALALGLAMRKVNWL